MKTLDFNNRKISPISQLSCSNLFALLFRISQIYCYGPLIHTVQMAKLYKDSKTFVDMKLKRNPDETLESFNKFMNVHDQKPTKDEIRKFVNVSLLKNIN